MVRASIPEVIYSATQLRDSSPVIVVHIQKKRSVAELPPPDPVVLIYSQPTLGQSWDVVKKGSAMLCDCMRSSLGRYLRRCNLAYLHLAGIPQNDSKQK